MCNEQSFMKQFQSYCGMTLFSRYPSELDVQERQESCKHLKSLSACWLADDVTFVFFGGSRWCRSCWAAWPSHIRWELWNDWSRSDWIQIDLMETNGTQVACVACSCHVQIWMMNTNLTRYLFTYTKMIGWYLSIKILPYHFSGYAMDIVQVTWTQDTGGSPRYMAPECFVVGSCITEKAKKGMCRWWLEKGMASCGSFFGECLFWMPLHWVEFR